MKIDYWLLTIGLLIIVSSAMFIAYPQIDLKISALFWSADQGFLFQKTGFGQVFTIWLHSGMRIVFFTYVIIQGGLLISRRSTITWRKYLFVILSTALAAGLITNLILKDHWGRARPVQIVDYDGPSQFTPAWIISDQCHSNCSFVAGDVSFAFCALAPALLARRNRRHAIIGVVLFGIFVSFGRIAAGAHFFSDVVLAGLLTSGIILLIYKFIFLRKSLGQK